MFDDGVKSALVSPHLTMTVKALPRAFDLVGGGGGGYYYYHYDGGVRTES